MGGGALALGCLVGAPIVGFAAAGAAPHPEGNGPGALQVVVGVGLPLAIGFLLAWKGAGRSPAAAAGWGVAAVAATGVLAGLLWLFVFEVIQPV